MKLSIYKKRWQWWPPWEVTDWWKLWLERDSDEYGNLSILFNIPPFGAFVIFYGKKIDRSDKAFRHEERRYQEDNNDDN